jgi:hypothetical protein
MPSGRDSFRRNRVAPFIHYITVLQGMVRSPESVDLAGFTAWPESNKQQLSTPPCLLR